MLNFLKSGKADLSLKHVFPDEWLLRTLILDERSPKLNFMTGGGSGGDPPSFTPPLQLIVLFLRTGANNIY